MRFREKGNVFFDPDRSSVNLNDYVAVELTEEALAHWNRCRQKEGLFALTNPNVEFQLWELMNIFGPLMSFGSASPFVGNKITISVPVEVKHYYTKDGKLHNTTRPAIEYSNGNSEWFVNGEEADPLVAMLHAKDESD